MKKTFLLLAGILIAVTLQAQHAFLIKPPQSTWLMRNSIAGIPAGQTDASNYFYVSVRPMSIGKAKSSDDHLFTIDKDNMSVKDMSLSASNLHTFLGALQTDDKIIALYQSLSKKGDEIMFSIGTFDKSATSATITDANSVSTAANSRFWPSFQTVKSPDGKLLASLVMVTGKNSELENLYAVVVNNQGEFLWHGVVTPKFAGQNFSLGNMAVNNEGNIYIPAYTCNVKGNKVSDVQFLVIKTNADGSETYSADVTFGKPQHFTTKVLYNGTLAIGGFFTDTYKDIQTQSNGYFFYRFDPTTNKFTDAYSFDFSSNYAQKNAPARLAWVLGNQQYAIQVGEIFELENGSLALCGEHRFVKAIRDMNTNSTTYQLLTKNILVATLHPDRTSSFSMIEKQQIGGGSIIPGDWKMNNISYSAAANGNNLYFLFNDNPKNVPYPGNGAICNMGGLKINTDAKCVLMTLTPDQEVTQKVLPNGDQVMRAIEFADDESIYVSGISKAGLNINKFDLDK